MLEYICPTYNQAKMEIEDHICFVVSVGNYDIGLVINGIHYTIPVRWERDDEA